MKKYIVTVEQLAKIVDYCVHMTVAGSGISKDWTRNVEEAIGVNSTRTIKLTDKIPLQELSNKEGEK